MPADNTPMRSQYLRIKEQHKDCILFFRLGDFYEMFDEDAYIAAKELDLTLTTRDRTKENPEERTPMCGVPFHSCESYISRLIAKGYKVAICEQTEDPALAKGLVSRDVIRIITPGTVTDGAMLEESRPNYLCAVYCGVSGGALCFADVSTGEICAGAFTDNIEEHLKNELGRFFPREVILNSGAWETPWLVPFLRENIGCLCQQDDARFDFMLSAARVCEQFSVSDIGELGLEDAEGAVCAAGALLSYLHETQKTSLTHINALSLLSEEKYMELDISTRRSLELTQSLRSGEKKGSLLWVLDKTRTSMGARLLSSWLSRPLLSPAPIKKRLNAVSDLVHDTVARGELAEALKSVGDIERLISRVVCGSANCRDLAALAASAENIPRIKELLRPMRSSLLSEIAAADDLSDIRALIDEAIIDDPPLILRDGGLLKDGYNAEVDRLRSLVKNSRGCIAEVEAKERERTGVKKLRIGYNRVFGYYIEMPRSSSEDVPADYIRKQTLANTERFVTKELQELENAILSAGNRLSTLEYELFNDLRCRIAGEVERIQSTAAAIARADVICSFAEISVKNGYCMPEVDISDSIDITDGRHPVVEKALRDGLFVANDTKLDCSENRAVIITGPNMAGKSTYMRQVALIVLMAQIGCFVPARSAHIGIVDRIFTRIGASDDLAGGRSTFMVEMTEVAEILKNATKRSLLILDEIGRGTSTYDGLSIARAVLEYCADKRRLGAKTLFSTHYHELTELENETEGVKNYNIAAKKRGDDIIFLRRIVPGGADESYGIEVAKLSGVPDSVIKRAKVVLADMQSHAGAPAAAKAAFSDEPQISFETISGNDIAQKLIEKDLNTLTPIEAMNFLFELKKMTEKI